MKKFLTGLALVLMLSGCGPRWTNADVYMALAFCAEHKGLRYIDNNYVVCNDGTTESRGAAYEKTYGSK